MARLNLYLRMLTDGTVIWTSPTGLSEAVGAVWDLAIVQTCVIHLLRNTFRYTSRKYWDQIAKDIRPVYTAPTEAAAKERFVEFTDKWGAQYPAIIRFWDAAEHRQRLPVLVG